jgi:HNH endonuclease
VEELDRRQLGHVRCTTEDLVTEITSFVSQFLILREIEKKRLRESGEVYSNLHLRQQIVLRWTQTPTNASCFSTERYAGGAKEHARSRMESGTATATDLAVLEGRRCAYCAGELGTASRNGGVISTYCSKECADEGRLKRGGMFASSQIRTQVFALEGGVCRLCGIDAHALYTRIVSLAPAERLNALCNVHWKLPKSSKALERLLQHPKEGDFWQADHIKAVAEGGGGCDLENFRTLCVPCHAMETEKLRGRLKLAGPSSTGLGGSQEETVSSMRQTDIRSMFGRKTAPSVSDHKLE